MHLIFYLFPAAFLFKQGLVYAQNKQLIVIFNGVFTGSNRYPYRYISCSDLGFDNNIITYLLPPLALERTRVDSLDLLCAPIQRTANQTANFLRLNILFGAYIAIKYLKNRYVTLLQIQLGKLKAGGTVYIFSIFQPSNSEVLVDVLQWTSDSTGGDQRGKLLTAQNFNNNRYY